MQDIASRQKESKFLSQIVCVFYTNNFETLFPIITHSSHTPAHNEQSKRFTTRFENLLLFRAVVAGFERAIGGGSNDETVHFLPNLRWIGDEATADGRTYAECYHSRKPDLPERSAKNFGHDAFKRGHDCLRKHSRGDHGRRFILGKWK